MSDILVDSNVIIDILDADSNWAAWSSERVREGRRLGNLVINPLIYAEVAGAYSGRAEADRAISATIYRRESLPWDAAFVAGRVFRSYRRAGGERRSPLPDFYIGAHADSKGYRLLTRDPLRYRRYFPTLKVIAPDTHP